MSEGPLFDLRDFIIADGIAHLCAGGESACLHRHATALSRYLRDKSSGMAGRVAQEAEIAVPVPVSLAPGEWTQRRSDLSATLPRQGSYGGNTGCHSAARLGR
jgi:hypothetical protein